MAEKILDEGSEKEQKAAKKAEEELIHAEKREKNRVEAAERNAKRLAEEDKAAKAKAEAEGGSGDDGGAAEHETDEAKVKSINLLKI